MEILELFVIEKKDRVIRWKCLKFCERYCERMLTFRFCVCVCVYVFVNIVRRDREFGGSYGKFGG